MKGDFTLEKNELRIVHCIRIALVIIAYTSRCIFSYVHSIEMDSIQPNRKKYDSMHHAYSVNTEIVLIRECMMRIHVTGKQVKKSAPRLSANSLTRAAALAHTCYAARNKWLLQAYKLSSPFSL